MQLWQTDITSFVLPRSKDRVYLVVFMDDHSRYIVSWSFALKQTGQFVIDSLVDLEFWNRVRPQTLDNAIERFKHFVNTTNIEKRKACNRFRFLQFNYSLAL